ncbi:glycosyltransferase family 2 protein [Salinigranum marinum]|uniref:glycosyltransferase family 2 protein n=1 Tax=Salinigranum marinum TaxID=1515595 RepID=UPI002989B640|nr:glycosyltransferase family 2 protein [Salinigranum marinum]
MSKKYPSVNAIIINWENYEDTSNCIKSLKESSYRNFDITVVDNGSTDESLKKLRVRFPDVNFIGVDSNKGFGAAVNRAVEPVKNYSYDYTWVLNNDVIFPDQNLLTNLVQDAEENTKIGIITPKVLHYPEINKVWFIKGQINWNIGYPYHQSESQHLFDIFRSNENYSEDILQNDYIPFCSALIRTDVFREVGGIPEDYFLYFEDVEYCCRVSEAGFEVKTSQKSIIYHRESSSSAGARKTIPSYYMARNRWHFYRDNDDKIGLLFYMFSLIWILLNILDRAHKKEWMSIIALLLGSYDGILGVRYRGRYP